MPNFFNCVAVKELKPSDFDAISTHKLKKKSDTFVLFYAPWCGHCVASKKDWCKAAQKVGFTQFAAFDSEKYSEHIRKMNMDNKRDIVQGFPTLVYYKNGEIKDIYQGDRSEKALIAYAMKMKRS